MTNKKTLDQLSVAASQRVKERDYWLTKLSGFWQKSRFPLDYNRKETAPHRMNTVSFEFSRQLSAALIKLSADSDVRLHMILVAGLNALLHRYLQAYNHQGTDAVSAAANGSDIVVGAPILRPDVEADFINTNLVLRNPVHPHMTFKELLLGVRQTVTEALDHRNYPVEVLAEQLGMSCNAGEEFPLFDIAVMVENIHDKKFLHPLRLNMIFSFTRRNSDIEGCLEYNPLLYKDDTASRLAVHLQRLLSDVSAHLETRVSALDLMSPDERERLLSQFNNTAVDFPADKTLHKLFEQQAEAAPHRTAVVGTGFSLSYGELKEETDRLASLLREKGEVANTIVGILTDRSLEMVIGILGILKSGAAYLPIDPAYPGKRIDYILQDSGANILLSEAGRVSEVGCDIEVIELKKNIGPIGPIGPIINGHPAHLCYIIYTSGSTGKPKGVMVEHCSVVNILYDQLARYPFGENDTYLLKTSFVFDVSVIELFGWFMGGGRLAVLEKGAEKDPRKILAALREYRVTHLNFVPALFNAFVGILDPGNVGHLIHLKYLFLAGEKLWPELVKKFRARISGTGCDIVLENIYGPTEATIYACGYSLSDWDGESDIPIGKPLGNITLHILNQYGDMQPIGIPGELCIAGAGLARGYLNRPELTAEKFNRSYKSYRTYILYKTGDIAMWLPNGSIAFLGRIDHQVKVRGFRIELGEIENHLLNHGHIKEAKVAALKAGTPGVEEDVALCAYIVPVEPDGQLSISRLREYLSLQLPDYMVPAYFVPLSDMPLTPTGKIDIKALPGPQIVGTGADYAAPRDAVEEKLVEVWKEVLNIDAVTIGIEDNFFHLGGHSLKATTMVYRLYRELGVNIEIADVFDHPTIRGLARQVKDFRKDEYVEIEPVLEEDDYDLSFAQRRLWVLCQFEEDSTAYNMPGAFTISGPLDVPAFAGALQALVDRHESLRTVFISVNGDPRQKVIPALQCPLEQIDLRHLDADTKEEETRNIYLENSNRAFDLENGPLFRFKLVRWEEESYVVIFNIHHIVNDGWSQGIIYNEIVRLYNAFLKDEDNPLPPLKLQYKDYSRWHNRLIQSNHFDQSRHYWLEKFKDKPNGIELPLDHSRQPIQTFNGGRIAFTLDKEKTVQLYRLSLREDATLFMNLLTLLNIFLFRYSGQKDIIIGSPIANRKRPELHHMVGFLVNTLIYRTQVDPAKSFRELLAETKQEALTCYRFQDYPFDLLVEELGLDRDMSQSPLFNVMLAHNNADTEDTGLRLEGVRVSEFSHHGDFNMSKFDLVFFMDEFDDQVSIRIEYNSDLFERSSIERMPGNFLRLVEHIVDNDGMDIPISELKIISCDQYERIIRQFNATRHLFPPLTLRQMLESQAGEAGEKTALVYNGEHVTYKELAQRTNRLAHYLREEFSVQPNDIIGVSVDRSIDMIVTLLGIMKSGAAYLALDPSSPESRILYMLQDSQANLLVKDKTAQHMFRDYNGSIIDIRSAADKMAAKSTRSPAIVTKASDILYVTYTSGSTGKPNGAVVSHDILTNLIRWQKEKTSVDGSLRCLQFASINFDVSFQEIMSTLTAGGELHLIGEMERKDIDYLMGFLSMHCIEILYLPFYYLNFLFTETDRWSESYRHSLKHLVTAGEQLIITPELKSFLDLNPGVQLHNHYGPAEMHVVTSYTLDASTAGQRTLPPIGKPISNVNIYILDECEQPVPVGVWGEIYIVGPSSFVGYLNKPDLTGRKLLKAGVCSDGKRLYRSGDIGRWKEDGNIELRGRKDFQVKIRGFRIELGEIESKLLAVENIRECVVVVKEDDSRQKYLVAYVSVDNIDIPEIKKRISNQLPQYMIPHLVVLDNLPLMHNGKVDRKRLPEPQLGMETDYTAPRDRVEETLAEIWAEMLGMGKSKIGIDANFFELGGHSLKATLMMSQIQKQLGKKIPLAEIFKALTIRELAAYLKGVETQEYALIPSAKEKDFYILSPAQKRLYILQQMETDNISYNLPAVVVLEGELDKEKLENTFHRLIVRHESLRTSFEMKDGEPVQKIHPPDAVAFEIECYPAAPNWPDSALLISQFIRAFDLSRPPLLRVGLIEVEENKHIAMYDMHHIIADGVSIGIFAREFMTLYGGEALPALNLHYKDYSEWQAGTERKEAIRAREEYWVKQFEGDIPVLDLPTDHHRPRVQSFEGRSVFFQVGQKETRALEQIALGESATLYMVLLSLYNIFVSRLSGREDVVVGTPFAGRSHADLRPVIGMFVNTLALRNYPEGEKSFNEFLKEVKERTLEAFENQDYPFEDLVEKVEVHRDAGRNPLFDVMFALQNMDIDEVEIPGLKLMPYPHENRTSKFDLTLQGAETDSGLDFKFEYSTKLFKETTIQRFINYFKQLISSMLHDPDACIADLCLIPEDEKQRLLVDFNNTDAQFPADKTIHQLFEEQVTKTPGNIAVVGMDGHIAKRFAASVTYRELNETADRVAGLLKEKGVEPGSIVGIMVERSPEMVIGILGILKAGGAYLPIDPAYPRERIHYMLEDSGAKLLLSEVSEVGGDIEVIDFDGIIGPIGPIGPILKKELASHPTDPGYIIYTSGSTGKPKGVVVEHGSVVNILFDLFERYPFGEDDTYLLKTSYVFDVSVTELFGWFLGGGRLAVLEKGGEKDPQAILDAVEGFGVSHINFVPAMFHVFLEALNPGNTGRLAGLRYIFLAGEALPPWLVEKFRQLHLDTALENIYGPTEGTVYVSQYSLAQWDGTGDILIGKPMRNTRLYILDKYGSIQPTGVAGELCTSGTGLARGYLNNPLLTAEKFNRSYRSYRSYILYKTGDLARWLPDGNIEFLGRMDHQVKIRGFRVEPGEIESRLLNHEAVKEVVVTEVERGDGEKYLCAYVVTAGREPGAWSTEDLREYLSRFLPGYMIPAYFVPLKNIPLNPSGKVDRKQLPLPGAAAPGAVYTAPGDMVEQQLVTLWSHLLLIEKNRIGIDDNFFHLGGHSLKGTLLISEIHKTFNVKMPLGEMFKTPSIRGLSKYIREAAEDRYAAIVPAGEKDYYRLSSAQKRLYLVERMADTGTGYNMPAVVKLEGVIERDRLENGFRQLILRHESFRTSFSMVEGQPVQQVHREVDFEIEYESAERTAQSAGRKIKNFIRPFDLAQAPLLRVGLIELPGERGASHILMVDMHHIISDGISLDIVVREFAALYGGETPAPLNLQYKDFAEWQNSEAQRSVLVSQEDYWKEQFHGEIPVLALPTDHPRPVVQRFEGNTISFDIGSDAAAALTAVALEQGATPYMILFALYNIFISKITGQEDIVTGTPTAGRRHAGLEQMVGMFVNTLAVRSYPFGEKTFTAFLTEIKETILTAFENQDYQYEDLVEQVAIRRDTGRNPLFDTVFAMQQRMEGSAIEVPGLKVSPYDYRNATAKFDLTLHCIETGGNLRFAFEYSTALFNETTILRFTRYLRRLVSDVLADGSRCLEKLEILPEQEKQQVLFDFNNTAREYPGAKTIHRLFEEQVEKTPGKIALIAADGTTLTYRQLEEKARGAAARLMEKGAAHGSIVGILGDRSPGMVAGILGILKTGAVYLPIDVDYPEERQNYMLKDSGAGILLDTREQDIEEMSAAVPPVSPSSLVSSSPAYIMYTSGSTGRPKGVVVTHRNVVRLVKNTNFVPLNRETCILQTGAPVFDATTFEIWGSLLNGGQLVLTGKEVILDAHRLAHALEEYRVNTLWLSAPLFNQLMQQNIRLFSPLRYLLVGGDTLSPSHINRVKQRFPQLNIINGYGPTENTTFSATYLIEEEFEHNIPIGAPIANSSAYIVDKSDNPQPIGVYGELLVAGDGLSLGYLNNPELTAEVFNRSYRSYRTYNFYKTGDLARWLPDGNIEFSGRVDHQLKIRGFRVEPGEIEKQLLKHDDVKASVVIARKNEKGDKYLCAYIVPDHQASSTVSGSQLREYLFKSLPDYMVPSHFMCLEAIPLNVNGKVDRRALPEPESSGEYEEYAAPQNEIQGKMAAIWEQELEVSPIGIHDDFFERGGHSLKAIGVTNKIEKTFGVSIAIQDLFQHPTIAEISRLIEGRKVIGFREIEKQPEREYYELSYAQKRLWYICESEPDNPLFNLTSKITLYEAVDESMVREILEQLAARHESFRTSFQKINMEPVQVIELPHCLQLNFEVLDWSGLPEEERERKRNRLLIEESSYIFALDKAPLFRFKLIKCAAQEYDFVYNMHHIISDGWSLEILKQEFNRLYEARKKDIACELEPLELQYKDYAAWQNQLLADEEQVGKANEFWKEQLSGNLPVSDLPYDFTRRSDSKESAGYRFVIPGALADRLRVMAGEQGGSLFMVLLAGFNVLLSQITGQKDIVIAIPAAARQHEALKNIIGMFVNTLILRNHVIGDETFVNFFKRLQDNTFKVLEYQGIPLELICGQLGIRYPDISVFFNMVNIGSTHRENVNDLNDYHMEKVQNAKFDMVCYLTEYKNGIEINCHYFKERFKPATIEKLMALYSKVLENISAEPAKKIAEYSFRGKKRKLKPGR